jgi:hypothetical protein
VRLQYVPAGWRETGIKFVDDSNVSVDRCYIRPMSKITKVATLRRTKTMLSREWALTEEPTSDEAIKTPPPAGLGKNDNQLRALETPIETIDFADVDAEVAGADLTRAKTVADLRDVIWKGIPAKNKSP